MIAIQCGVISDYWLLYGRRFCLTLKGAVCNRNLWPAVLYGSEAWCLKENEMEISLMTGRSMVRAMCGVQLKDGKMSKNLMLPLGLNETIKQLTVANSIHWCTHLPRREDGRCVEKGIVH